MFLKTLNAHAQLLDLDVERSIILHCIFRVWKVVTWVGFMAGFFVNEVITFVKALLEHEMEHIFFLKDPK